MYFIISFFSTVDLVACIAAFIFGLAFIFSIPKNKSANLFLGLFLFSLSLEIFEVLTEYISSEIDFVPQTSLLTVSFLFFYVLKTIHKPVKYGYYCLFLPGILVNAFLVYDDYLVLLFEYAFNLTLLVYLYVTIKKLKKQALNFYSDLERKTLDWINVIIYIHLGFYSLWIVEELILLQNEELIGYFATASSFFTFFMVLWIGHNGFAQQEIFKPNFVPYRAKKTKTSEATPERQDTIETVAGNKDLEQFQQVCEEIAQKELFKNPKLNLSSLALDLEIKEKELSRLINQESSKNFYQFINEFRIKAFKELLSSDKAKKLSIAGLAEEAGFNSKSTFYAAFKSLEGITPKQYEQQIKLSE